MALIGCATGPGVEDARADLIGTWRNPEYETLGGVYYTVLEIDPDLTVSAYTGEGEIPSRYILSFVRGRETRDGATLYTFDSVGSLGEGFVVYKMNPDESFELIHWVMLKPEWEYPTEVDPSLQGYRGIYERE